MFSYTDIQKEAFDHFFKYYYFVLKVKLLWRELSIIVLSAALFSFSQRKDFQIRVDGTYSHRLIVQERVPVAHLYILCFFFSLSFTFFSISSLAHLKQKVVHVGLNHNFTSPTLHSEE